MAQKCYTYIPMRLPLFVILPVFAISAHGGTISLPEATATVLAGEFDGAFYEFTGPPAQVAEYIQTGVAGAEAQALPEGPITIIVNDYPIYGPSVGATSNGDLLATSSLTYYFIVSGTAGTQVPIDVSGFVVANISAPALGEGVYAAAYATMTITDETTGAVYLEEYVCNGACGSGPTLTYTTFLDLPLMITAGDEVQVQMGAVANPQGAVSTTAIADPYFQIDPTFASENPGYNLEFSAGVDNAEGPAAVPESSTLGLVGVGVLLIVLGHKRLASRERNFYLDIAAGCGGVDQ